MAASNMDEVIKEILQSIDAVSESPCTNTYCADCDGKCARKWCGGYTSEKDGRLGTS